MEIVPSSNSNINTNTPCCAADHGVEQTILEAIPVITSALDGGWFGKISTTLILLFGTFGNVMTVIILRRLRSGWSAMNVYLTALALSDTAMLYSGTLLMWSRKVLDYDIFASHVVVCKLGIWVMNTAAALSAWLLVALTAQRAASVVWPHRVNVMCTRHKSVIVIVVINVVCGLLYSHTAYGYDMVKFDNGTRERCTFSSVDYQEFYVSIWVRIDIFIFCVLPSVSLIVSNAVLGWKLAAAVKQAKEKLSNSGGDRKNSREKKASSVTVTIFIVSTAFVFATAPLATYNTFFFDYALRDVDYFLYDVFFMFGTANFAWNFYLYCLTGSRFREEFKNISGCRVSVASAPGSAYVTEMSEVTQRGSKERDLARNDDF